MTIILAIIQPTKLQTDQSTMPLKQQPCDNKRAKLQNLSDTNAPSHEWKSEKKKLLMIMIIFSIFFVVCCLSHHMHTECEVSRGVYNIIIITLVQTVLLTLSAVPNTKYLYGLLFATRQHQMHESWTAHKTNESLNINQPQHHKCVWRIEKKYARNLQIGY